MGAEMQRPTAIFPSRKHAISTACFNVYRAKHHALVLKCRRRTWHYIRKEYISFLDIFVNDDDFSIEIDRWHI